MQNANLPQALKTIINNVRFAVTIAYVAYGAYTIGRIVFEWTKAGANALRNKFNKK